MEALIITGACNLGVIIIGGGVNFIIHKFHRSKLKKSIMEIMDAVKKNERELIEIKTSLPTTPQEPFDDVATPSEQNYRRPDNQRHRRV